MRPAEISGDVAPALPVMSHALDWLDANDGWSGDAIAYLQPTSPFRDASDIDAAVEIMRARDADTVVSVIAVPHNLSPTSLMDERDGWLSFVAPPEQRQFRRQAKERLYARNGPAILLNRTSVVAAGDLYGERVAGYEMPRLASLDIDEPEDLSVAEALLPLASSRRSGKG